MTLERTMSKNRLGVLATKVGMTQIFMEDGLRVPVTILHVTPNTVVQKRTVDNDGYTALQIGTGDKREKLLNKAQLGHFKKHSVQPQRHLVEFRVDGDKLGQWDTGKTYGVELLDGVKSVDVASTSKGKGTAGVMKRHHMKGFRATHGTHEYFRHGGSIGCRATPGKVHKGKRMSGRMGNERVTTLNIMIVKIDAEQGLVYLRGAVPGAKGALVEVQASTHTAQKGRALRSEAQILSKNPMKASKAGGSSAKPKK
jgi:large subunit ribosomal protein L3